MGLLVAIKATDGKKSCDGGDSQICDLTGLRESHSNLEGGM
jgi:hypothetical protein